MIPPGWRLMSVGHLAANEPGALTDGPFGSNLKTEHYTESGPRVVRLQNIGGGQFVDEYAHISNEHFARLSKHSVKGGDVLVAMLGERLPRACLAPDSLGPAIVKADCARLRVNESVASPRFVMHLLNSPTAHKAAADLVHGVGRPRLGLGILRSLELPVADRHEQDLIVAAIESHFSRLDAATATLERVQRNLERYRASVLKAAVEGRLVPTEAELAKKEDRSYEPAAVLLKRILAERRRRWEEAELAKLKAKGKAPTDDRWKAKYEEPVAPDADGLPELPEGWCWASVALLGEAVTGSTPPTDNPAFYSGPDGLPFFKPTDLDAGYHLVVARQHLSESGSGRARVLPEGSVLVTCIGATIGKTGLARVACCTNQQINALVAAEALRSTRFLYWFFVSPLGQAAIKGSSSATTLPILNKGKFERVCIPLPPLAEQHRIVSSIDRQVSIAEEAERQVAISVGRIRRLRQSILKWAFEGRLVAQNK